jgi:hypothetical protein
MSRSIMFEHACRRVLSFACVAVLLGCSEEPPQTDWCVNLEDAQMWPVDQPELAQQVFSEQGGPPIGCRCFDEAEVQILASQSPADEYDELVAHIEEDARNECAWIVPPGNDFSCYIEDGPLAPRLTAPYPGDRIGACE